MNVYDFCAEMDSAKDSYPVVVEVFSGGETYQMTPSAVVVRDGMVIVTLAHF